MRSIAFVFVLGLCSCAKDYSFVNEDKPNKEDLAPDASAGAGELLCLDEETCYRKDELEALTPVELGDNAFSCNGQGICYRASALDILIPVEPDRIADDFTCLPTGVCLRNASLRDLTPLTPQELTDLLENKVSCREDGVCYRATALRDLKEEEENAKGVTCLTNGACYRARNIEELTPLSQADLTSLAEGALLCGPEGCYPRTDRGLLALLGKDEAVGELLCFDGRGCYLAEDLTELPVFDPSILSEELQVDCFEGGLCYERDELEGLSVVPGDVQSIDITGIGGQADATRSSSTEQQYGSTDSLLSPGLGGFADAGNLDVGDLLVGDAEVSCFWQEGTGADAEGGANGLSAVIRTARTQYEGREALHVIVTFARRIVDNTYGSTSSTYRNPSGKSIEHSFDQLLESDKATFFFHDGTGKLVLSAAIDYVSPDPSAPSGYACLGLGGEGGILSGPASAVLGATSSIDRNLNEFGYHLTSASPATDEAYTPNPEAPRWNFSVEYEAWIDLSVFGAAGPGTIEVREVHASPSRLGKNSVPIQTGVCE